MSEVLLGANTKKHMHNVHPFLFSLNDIFVITYPLYFILSLVYNWNFLSSIAYK